MAITLAPPINQLGIMAPVLGPWFSNPVTLPAPDPAGTLGLTVNLPAGTDWFAPAAGTLSLYLTGGAPPAALDALQDATGAFPFPAGRILALFRLLPEVAARLHALMGLVPPATGGAVPAAPGVPTRPEVRSLAILLPAGAGLTPAALYPFLGGVGSFPQPNDTEKVAALGLAISGGNIANGAVPMTWLRRPGGALADRDRMLTGLGGNHDLWAFDRRGRAIDPGAVAAWWSWLLNTGVGDPASGTAFQLLAPSLTAADFPQAGGVPVVCAVAAARTVHLVDAHEGPLGAPFLNGRLRRGGSAVAARLLQQTDTTGIALTIAAAPANTSVDADNPTVDDAPRPRLALLPAGTYAAGPLTLFPAGPVQAGLPRDFVRVAAVEEESFLTGLARRDSRLAAATPADRRASDQNRPSTRILVGRTTGTGPVLLADSRAVADALLALPGVAAPTRLVLGLADQAWGGTPGTAAPTPGAGPLPVVLADAGAGAPTAGQYRVRALAGGGATTTQPQTVLVEVALGAPGAGAWVRAWPLGFDLATGTRFRLSGGAGRADAAGLAVLPMVLPNGRVDPNGLLGMDLLVLLPDGTGAIALQRGYADRRFARPVPLPGAPPTTVSGNWRVAETGASGSGALPAGAVPPGGHVILMDTPALLDRTAIPAAARDPNTLGRKLQATDIVSLTEPAFGSTPDRADAAGRPLPRVPISGDPTGGLSALLAGRLHRMLRDQPGGAVWASTPYALLDRLEVAAATVAAGAATAVIGSAPAVPWALEPATAQFLGHPGVPAAIEIHGTGAALSGTPALAVAEYVRERTAGLSDAAFQGLAEPQRSAAVQSEFAVAFEARTPLPAIAEAGVGPVVAVLRTVAFGMEGTPGVATAATLPGANLYPFSRNIDRAKDWLDARIPIGGGAGTALSNAIGTPGPSIARALDRRIQASAFGAREALVALIAAIGRAQDLVLLETPALDALPVAGGGETLNLWQALLARMTARPGLRAVLIVPTLLGPGTPRMLQQVRDKALLDAVDAIRAAAPDRFALVSPGAGAGRAVRFASTSVVIDDAFALTGTTHLWRRGLSWDSSLAAAVFDERLVDGRPQEVRGFRIRLLADRLGVPTTRVPEDPAELVKAIRTLDARGTARLSATAITRPNPAPQNGDLDAWDPDGSRTDLDLAGLAAALAGALALTDTAHAIVEG